MRRARARDRVDNRQDPPVADGRGSRLRANGWPVLPLRVFLAALFGFAGYAKLSYPGFFDPNSPNGLKASVQAARHGTPIGSALGPLSDHPSLFGHVTAYAEIVIGLGLLVGLLTRLAALGGMVLTALILLSIDWGGVKEYTGSSGWFTSVDLAVAAALSVFLLGGAGPFALDNVFLRARERDRARDDNEPSFRDSDYEDSRRRLQGEPIGAERSQQADRGTEQLPAAGHRGGAAGYQDAEYRDDPEPAPNSQRAEGRRIPEPHSGASQAAPRPPDAPPAARQADARQAEPRPSEPRQ